MKLHLAHYRLNFPIIESMYKRDPGVPLPEIASRAAVATECPIIVVYHYLGEIIGFTPEILGAIERVKKFYKVEEVILDTAEPRNSVDKAAITD